MHCNEYFRISNNIIRNTDFFYAFYYNYFKVQNTSEIVKVSYKSKLSISIKKIFFNTKFHIIFVYFKIYFLAGINRNIKFLFIWKLMSLVAGHESYLEFKIFTILKIAA